MTDDKRLIEVFLPLAPISEQSRQENRVTQAKGYLPRALLTLLHRWWARRPLTACRAAVYTALVPAPESESALKAEGEFITKLCEWKAPQGRFVEARKRIRIAHRGKVPRVLDMFAGGGSIPLEAARLGCESHAVELNPVAYLVLLGTLVYPAQFGRKLLPLVKEWSAMVLERAKTDMGDSYQEMPGASGRQVQNSFSENKTGLTPLTYLWTRTVPCRRPGCGAHVPLHRQLWLRKKSTGFIAARPVPDKKQKRIFYELLKSDAEDAESAIAEWGYNPEELSVGGETTCLLCKSSISSAQIKDAGQCGEMGASLIAVVTCVQGERGKIYIPATADNSDKALPADITKRLEELLGESSLEPLNESLPNRFSDGGQIHPYGFKKWRDIYTPRQMLLLFSLVRNLRAVHQEAILRGEDADLCRAVATYIAFIIDRVAERSSTITHWDAGGEFIQTDIGDGKLPMTWDFPESNPLATGSGSWMQATEDELRALEILSAQDYQKCVVKRASALALPFDDASFDAVITDPPYYQNVFYASLADYFFVLLRRSVGHLYPEHFAGRSSPTKSEIVMDRARHEGQVELAKADYESKMCNAFSEACRVLKPGSPLVCVYAHKTTAGWSTLIEALRQARFVVTEAWPLDTENASRQRSKGAALASSIFLVARKRVDSVIGNHEETVLPELQEIIRERVDTLWEMGISGADLVIACVGAGLRAFTRFARVEYANGEEVPAERFLTEVETVVLDTILEKLSKELRHKSAVTDRRYSLAGLDPATRFYVLWRYTYGAAELDAGEAIIFANGTHVELDGPLGLSTGSRALVEKKKSKYKLRDFAERGDDDNLGLPEGETGESRATIDVLHRLLWLLEKRPPLIPEFIADAQPNLDQLRLVAQALAGPALKGGELENISPTAEQSALGKLLANWSTVMEGKAAREDRRVGQQSLGI